MGQGDGVPGTGEQMSHGAGGQVEAEGHSARMEFEWQRISSRG